MQNKDRLRRILMILLCLSLGISVWQGVEIGRSLPGGMIDLQGIYYAAKCLIRHQDPYQVEELHAVYVAETGRQPTGSVVPPCVNVPSTLVMIAPLSLLPWRIASVLWLCLLVASFFMGAALAGMEAIEHSWTLSVLLVCLLAANVEVGFALTNAGIFCVGLCAIAVCHFIKGRSQWLGEFCLAAAVAIKPHDSILIALYFFLANAPLRMRILRAAFILILAGLPSIAWIMKDAPGWFPEWRSNTVALARAGAVNDAGPTGAKTQSAGQIIDLQAAIALVRDEPDFYNAVSYGVCGTLLLIWGIITIRAEFSLRCAWLAIATVIPLSLLVTYHRAYDAKILLLAIPACAMLWREGGWRGAAAAVVTTLAICATADIPLALISGLQSDFDLAKIGAWERIGMIPILRPAPSALLVMAVFYLWAYAKSAKMQLRRRTGLAVKTESTRN